MAELIKPITLGVDVSKNELVYCNYAEPDRIGRLNNEPEAIRDWLSNFSGSVQIALEPTSNYHLTVLEIALTLGFEVYLINPRQLAHYREAVGEANKSDPIDAYLLARYLDREKDQLRPFKPRDPAADEFWTLMKRRGAVVRSLQQLQQSLEDCKLSARALYTEFDKLLERIEKRMLQLIRQLDWWDDYQRCLSIPGIGSQNAMALTAVYHRAAFGRVSQFIAFIGMDIRIRESGCFKGKSKLTKRGESEIRRLLYCAAVASRRYLPFARYHQRQLDKGLPKIAANVVLARKLARIAFALLTKQEHFIRTI